MTKKCILCEETWNEFDKSRTFHLFPRNEELRKKWMDAIHLSSIKKNAVICGDHFDKSSFYDIDEYANKKRLRPNAIPLDENLNEKDRDEVLPSPRRDDSNNNSGEANKKETSQGHRNDDSNNLREANMIETSQSPFNDVNNNLGEANTKGVSQNPWNDDNVGNSDNLDQFHENRSESLIVSESYSDNWTVNKYDSETPAKVENTKNSCKRNNSSADDCPSKRYRFTSGSKTDHITRKDFISDEAWERFTKFTSYYQTRINTIRVRDYRHRKIILQLQSLVKNLKENQFSEAAKYLQDLPPHVQQLIIRMKDKKPTAPFPSHLKTFARGLHFHSPAAYEFVRRSFLKCLPCVETLNTWLCSKNYKPGICNEVIQHVSDLVTKESMKGKKLVFNITFDEMSIKKWKYWNKSSHEWQGVVDLGGQLTDLNENSELRVASEALVFMLVNINGAFKTPVAHYLISSLTGAEKSILLKDLLIKLSQNNIEVVSITFDGDRAHKTACELLGANLNYHDQENFKPYIDHPITTQPVYIFYDPCHMLKLVRNYFALKGPIVYDKKDVIDWAFINKLHEKQISEGLHCACKIRSRHVHFQNEKIKVFLAAQVLSSSVSIALQFLEYDLKDEQFKNASPTAKFCQMFNDIFDVLNVRNKLCKIPGRQGITKENLPELKRKIEQSIDFILKLEIYTSVKSTNKTNKNGNNNNIGNFEVINGNESSVTSILKSVTLCESVRTGFCGFIVSLKNLYSLCEDLIIKHNIVEYVLSYKLSQDHVETFFALIRRMNGFNNNPTSVQYLSAYKKLLTNNMNVTVPCRANCIPQDQTVIISDSTDVDIKKVTRDEHNNVKKQKPKNEEKGPSKSKITDIDVQKFLNNNYSSFEHDYSKRNDWCTSEYIDEIVKHIAGFIVHSLKKKVSCKKCLDMLYKRDSNQSTLTILKNRGGLQFASDDVNFICHSVEKILRRHKNLMVIKGIYQKLVIETIQTLPNTILDNDQHFLEQEPMFDHRHQLIVAIIEKYIDCRLTHEGVISNDVINRIRMRNNKLTIFSGQ